MDKQFKKGNKVKLLIQYEGQRATLEVGTKGTVTGQLGEIVSVRFGENLWLCDPKDIEIEEVTNEKSN